MPEIFICYRREDSEDITGRIYDRLASEFGRTNIFYDVDSMRPGVDFPDFCAERIRHSDAMIVVIGDQWLSCSEKDGDYQGQRRLDVPGDHVRAEVAAALNQPIPVFPVLVRKARMPKPHELPPELEKLANKKGTDVRSGNSFHRDLQPLVEELKLAAEVSQRVVESSRDSAASSAHTSDEPQDAPVALQDQPASDSPVAEDHELAGTELHRAPRIEDISRGERVVDHAAEQAARCAEPEAVDSSAGNLRAGSDAPALESEPRIADTPRPGESIELDATSTAIVTPLVPAPHPDVVARVDERRRELDQLLAEAQRFVQEMSWDAAIVTLRKARSRVDDPSEINAEIAAIEAKRDAHAKQLREAAEEARQKEAARAAARARAKAKREAAEKQQRKLEGLLARANAFREEGAWERAVALLKEARELASDTEEIDREIARLRRKAAAEERKRREDEEARQAAAKAAERKRLAAERAERERAEAAARIEREPAQTRPREPRVRSAESDRLRQRVTDLHYRARELMNRGSWNGALGILREARSLLELTSDPDPAGGNERESLTIRSGLDAAIAECERALLDRVDEPSGSSREDVGRSPTSFPIGQSAAVAGSSAAATASTPAQRARVSTEQLERERVEQTRPTAGAAADQGIRDLAMRATALMQQSAWSEAIATLEDARGQVEGLTRRGTTLRSDDLRQVSESWRQWLAGAFERARLGLLAVQVREHRPRGGSVESDLTHLRESLVGLMESGTQAVVIDALNRLPTSGSSHARMEQVADLQHIAALYCATIGDLSRALVFVDKAIDAFPGADQPAFCEYLQTKAGLLARLGRKTDACRTYEFALAVAVQVHGLRSPITASAQRNVDAARAQLAARGG